MVRIEGTRCTPSNLVLENESVGGSDSPMDEAATTATSPETRWVQVIQPTKGWAHFDFIELWRYRELLFFLVWRDVKIRYKQTALGSAWAILQPLMTMAVFVVLFGRLAGLGDKVSGMPYAIHVYAGLLPWTFFASSVTNIGGSLVGNSHLISKIYFPRLLIPLGAVGSGLVDLSVSLIVMVPLMIAYDLEPTWSLILLPLILLSIVMATAGVGSWLAALTVAYRDFRYVVPFTMQIWMFLTPIIYPSSMVPEKWRLLFDLNPMVGLIDGFRSCLLGKPLDWSSLIVSMCVSLGFLITGVAYFRQVERHFADII